MRVAEDTPENTDLNVEIVFNYRSFCIMAQVAGASNDGERAALIGVDPKTVWRARQGILGHTFMAKCVAGLRRHAEELSVYNLHPTLDALFVVREVAPNRELVAA